jgi:hypothetical protein
MDFTQQLNLNSDYRSSLNRLADRIEFCSSLPWCHVYCRSCGHQLTKTPFKQSCLSNFCSDPECLKNRKKIRRMKLNDYNIRSKKLYSFVVGFKDLPVSQLTKEQRKKYHSFFLLLLKKTLKVYGSFYYLSVRDLNKSGDNIRLHYHVATLPLKDFRFFVSCLNKSCDELSKKMNVLASVSLSGYKGKGSTLNYFSSRASGEFGHDTKGEHKFGFSDFMKLEQYYSVFYRTKTFNSNFRFRRHQTAELVAMLNNVPKICPNCLATTYKNIYFAPVPEPIQNNPPPIKIYSKFVPQIVRMF